MIVVSPLLTIGFEVFVLLLLVLSLLHFLVVGWGYNDAKVHSATSPYLWALVVVALPVAGILTYLHLERDGRSAAYFLAEQANRSS